MSFAFSSSTPSARYFWTAGKAIKNTVVLAIGVVVVVVDVFVVLGGGSSG